MNLILLSINLRANSERNHDDRNSETEPYWKISKKQITYFIEKSAKRNQFQANVFFLYHLNTSENL